MTDAIELQQAAERLSAWAEFELFFGNEDFAAELQRKSADAYRAAREAMGVNA